MSTPRHLLMAAAALAIALAGCTASPPPQSEQDAPAAQPQEQEVMSLFDELKAAEYTGWAPAPGYASPQPAKGPHGDQVQILLDPTAEQGLADGGGEWPIGAVIAKDIFQAGELVQIAAMKKTADGWYWGEWDPEGEPIAEGIAIEPCEGCHAAGTDGTLGVSLK